MRQKCNKQIIILVIIAFIFVGLISFAIFTTTKDIVNMIPKVVSPQVSYTTRHDNSFVQNTDLDDKPDTQSTNETTASTSETYYIQEGDTLCEISSKISHSVDAIAKYNDIRDVNKIYKDSVLRIPKEP